MKTKYAGFVLILLLVLSVGITYAHGVPRSNNQITDEYKYMVRQNNQGTYENVDEMIADMNEMHELMTANVDPELEEQFDELHESCLNSFRQEYAEPIGMGMMR